MKNWIFDMILLCLKWFCYIEKFIEWKNFRKAYKKTTLNENNLVMNNDYFFGRIALVKTKIMPTIECKIARPFIWDQGQLWNRDIDNSFPKKWKYWCIDFTDCTYLITFLLKQLPLFLKFIFEVINIVY